MVTAAANLDQTPEQDQYQQQMVPVFLTSMRQRFKGEVNRLTRNGMTQLLQGQDDVDDLSFLMSYLYIFHWLRHNVHEDYRESVLAAFAKGKQGFLMRLLLDSADGEAFVRGYIDHWQGQAGSTLVQKQRVKHLLAQAGNEEALVQRLSALWQGINPFVQSYAIAYKGLAKDERDRYDDMLGPEDKERLALVDALPDPEMPQPRFDKLGLIPAMGCPQTCRHCMFIFRPLMKENPDPAPLFEQVSSMTNSVLFTGGDLTKQLGDFYRAIGEMKNITTFAILLNGDFANDRKDTTLVLENMAKAIRRRPVGWPRAKVMLQISFDEFHQEVVVNKKGLLEERIPVRKIANIVEAAPKYGEEIQLCLLHKQQALNFSMEVFQKGVFARLAEDLGRRGHQVEVLSATPSKRLKRNPLNPEQPAAQVVKDASFILKRYPKVPIMLTSSTIDAYGRANEMDLSEAVRERDLLDQVLSGDQNHGESFDKDIMFWFNGWATLFSAVHMCLGNVHDEGMETILKRQRKDPLTQALNQFDLRLLDYYREKAGDLDEILERSTSPHHLFHTITEKGAMRLHMTRRLLGHER